MGGGQASGVRLVDTHQVRPGSVGEEAVERRFDALERSVVVEVVGLDVGDHRDLRTELDEGAIALVGLDHEPVSAVPHRATADLVELTTDDERRAQLGLHQHEGQHRRRGGLAVGAGDGDRAPGGGDGGEDLRSPQHGDASFDGRPHLGVRRCDGGRHGHRVDVADVRRSMADLDVDAEHPKSLEADRCLEVAARDLMPHGGQDAGDGAHAGAADPDDVDAAGHGEVDGRRRPLPG